MTRARRRGGRTTGAGRALLTGERRRMPTGEDILRDVRAQGERNENFIKELLSYIGVPRR